MFWILRALGITDAIKLDGGGSFILHNGWEIVGTNENRELIIAGMGGVEDVGEFVVRYWIEFAMAGLPNIPRSNSPTIREGIKLRGLNLPGDAPAFFVWGIIEL